MISPDSMLMKSEDSILIQRKDSWLIFNSESQAAIKIDERIIAMLESLNTPTYYGELELEYCAKYDDTTPEEFNISVKLLVDAGFILVNFMKKEDRTLIFADTPKLPSIAAVHVTYRCNLKCDYCYNEEQRTIHGKDERSKSDWKMKLLELQNMGIQRFDITGGEPLVRMELLPVYEELKANGAQIELITNGTLISDQEIANTIAKSVSRVTVSLDSFDPFEHDYYRGKGTHTEVERAMEFLTKAGVIWQAKGVLTDKNTSSLDRTKEYVKSLGGGDYAISIMVGEKRDDHSIYQQFYSSVIEKRIEKGEIELYPDQSFDLNMKYGKPCAAARYECAIDPDGGIYPCRVFIMPEFCCGNIFEEDINDIWKNAEVLQKFRNIDYRKLDKCGDCAFLRICLGGCRAIAYMESKSIYGPLDSFGCAVRKRRTANIITQHADAEQSRIGRQTGC